MNRPVNNTIQLLIYLISVCWLSACNNDLPRCSGSLTVTVFESTDNHRLRNESIINDVTLYIFDSNNHFIESRRTQLNRKETLYYPKAGKLTIVAWSNTASGSVDVSSLNNNSTPDNSFISLKESTKTTPTSFKIHQIPDDISYGSAQAQNNETEEEITVYIKRVVSSVNITARNLKRFAGFDDNNYSFVIGTTKSTINFNGEYGGIGAGYLPMASFNAVNDFVTPTFMLFPSKDETLSVSIYHGDTLVDQVWSDNNGKPLQCVENKTLYVLIDYSDMANSNITFEETEWNPVLEWDIIFK